MTFQIGDTAPDFEAETTQGRIRFHDWIGDSWVIFFSQPICGSCRSLGERAIKSYGVLDMGRTRP